MKAQSIAAALVAFAPVFSAALCTPRSANETLLLARDDDPYPCVAAGNCDTEIDIGKGSKIKAVMDGIAGINATFPDHAQAFTDLWDKVGEQCTDLQCGEDKDLPTRTCVPQAYVVSVGGAGGGVQGTDLCIEATGSFSSEYKGPLFELVKEAFYRSTTKESSDPFGGYAEYGINFIHAVVKAQGHNLNINIYAEEFSQDCPGVVKAIGVAGTLVPDVGVPFGIIGILCNLV